uniref:Uncharacterized protein n=1 Tax=Arundo donax TaxID=35708 RepID=A0A0A9BP94_ARUDO
MQLLMMNRSASSSRPALHNNPTMQV